MVYRRLKADRVIYVPYAGGRVKIRPGRHYYVDENNEIQIGWHGSYDPPEDMAGQSMIERDSTTTDYNSETTPHHAHHHHHHHRHHTLAVSKKSDGVRKRL